MEAKDALFIVAKVIVNLFSLVGDASTHGRLGKLTVKTGPHAHQEHMYLTLCDNMKRKEKTTPSGVNLMRTPVKYRAAQL